MALSMRLERLGALRDRETAVTDLMLLTAILCPPTRRCQNAAPLLEPADP